jgi:hypothetical protein
MSMIWATKTISQTPLLDETWIINSLPILTMYCKAKSIFYPEFLSFFWIIGTINSIYRNDQTLGHRKIPSESVFIFSIEFPVYIKKWVLPLFLLQHVVLSAKI